MTGNCQSKNDAVQSARGALQLPELGVDYRWNALTAPCASQCCASVCGAFGMCSCAVLAGVLPPRDEHDSMSVHALATVMHSLLHPCTHVQSLDHPVVLHAQLVSRSCRIAADLQRMRSTVPLRLLCIKSVLLLPHYYMLQTHPAHARCFLRVMRHTADTSLEALCLRMQCICLIE